MWEQGIPAAAVEAAAVHEHVVGHAGMMPPPHRAGLRRRRDKHCGRLGPTRAASSRAEAGARGGDAHAAGPVDDADLTAITTLATGALNHWLAQNANTSDGDPPQGVFAEVLDAPVGWAALSALAEASIDGGRVAFHQPDADLPAVPAVEAEQVRRTEGGAWVQSAVSHGWTQGLLDMLVRTDSGEIGAWTVSSLSRLTRSSSRLSWLLAFALSRGVPVMTSNFLLRPGEAFVRMGPLRVPEPTRPTLHLRDGAGLAGVHRKLARELADQLEMA